MLLWYFLSLYHMSGIMYESSTPPSFCICVKVMEEVLAFVIIIPSISIN